MRWESRVKKGAMTDREKERGRPLTPKERAQLGIVRQVTELTLVNAYNDDQGSNSDQVMIALRTLRVLPKPQRANEEDLSLH